MTWTLAPKGSWGIATTSNPATDLPTVLALPGSWQWFPANAVMVRKDQWAALAAPPAVDSITPNTGTAAGGDVVTLVGEGLVGSTGVTFAGTPGTAFALSGDTQIRVMTPAHAVGAVDVVVLNPRGNLTLTNGFTYQ
jgi:IPT/TIG domain